MAQDHFERHNHYEGVVDWNFNVTFEDQASVANMSQAYQPLLARPEFYDPIPAKWLHATILRVGRIDQYTEDEMLQVADIVQQRVTDIKLPDFHFGNHKIIFGNVCFPIEPEAELEKLYAIVTESLQSVVGEDRATKSPYGHFIAHASFAYTKQRSNESGADALLVATNIVPATFHIKHMPIVKQKPIDGHYEWEVVKDISIE